MAFTTLEPIVSNYERFLFFFLFLLPSLIKDWIQIFCIDGQ